MKVSHPFSIVNALVNRIEIRLKRTRLLSRPVELTLEPTLECNSNCIMCNRNFSRPEAKAVRGFLDWDVFRRVRPYFKYSRRVEFGGFGEPLLHPEYLPMLREIKACGPSVYFFTNGILMDERLGKGLVDAGTDRVFISVGGATRETYSRIRGVDAFDRVVDNIKSLTDYKRQTGRSKPRLAFNFVIMKSLLPELDALLRLASALGVEEVSLPNLVVQGKSMAGESLWNDPHMAEKTLQDAGHLARELGIEYNPPSLVLSTSPCLDFARTVFITWDGMVLSCPLERYLFGNIRTTKLNRIWNSPGLIRLRRESYQKGLDELCAGCTCWDNRPETFLTPWVNSRDQATKVN